MQQEKRAGYVKLGLGVALVPMRHLKHRKWTHEQGNATPSFEKNN